jgi:hypothetical protein
MNYQDYVKQVLSEHLLTPDYQYLAPNTAQTMLEQTKAQLLNNLHLHKSKLSQVELKL